MLDKGLKATVNSDDPSYFGGYLNDNYIRTAKALNLTQEQIFELVKNSFDGSFLDESRKVELLKELDEHYTSLKS